MLAEIGHGVKIEIERGSGEHVAGNLRMQGQQALELL
jgi:hypothetical protein